MMKISNEELMDYMDGTLDGARLAAVEEHLRTHMEDAEMVRHFKVAQEALRSWDDDEPVQASPDFWIKVRRQLPEAPPRSWFRRTGAQVQAWLWPSHALGRSLRAGLVAAAVALSFYFFAPQQDTRTAMASNQVPREAQSFIQQSLDRHAAYVSSQPLNGSLPIGDVRSAEHGDNDDAGHDAIP